MNYHKIIAQNIFQCWKTIAKIFRQHQNEIHNFKFTTDVC